jgi:hypothetical protein
VRENLDFESVSATFGRTGAGKSYKDGEALTLVRTTRNV